MDKVVKPKVAKQQFRSIEFFYPSPAPLARGGFVLCILGLLRWVQRWTLGNGLLIGRCTPAWGRICSGLWALPALWWCGGDGSQQKAPSDSPSGTRCDRQGQL